MLNPILAFQLVVDIMQQISQELKRLHTILAEKERELVTVKLLESGKNETAVHNLKSQVVEKEAKIHEVELTLEMEQRKIDAYEEHINYLKNQLQDVQNQASNMNKEKSSFLVKVKDSLKSEEDLNLKLVKELKDQLVHEQQKLQQVSELFIKTFQFMKARSTET